MISFFEDLRRRKVYRVAAGYAVVAWLLIQITATVFPIFDFPLWSVRVVVAIVLAGFPFALVIAWAFDLGPSGLTRAAPSAAAGEPVAVSVSRRRLTILVLAGAAVSIAVACLLIPRARLGVTGKSIAVL